MQLACSEGFGIDAQGRISTGCAPTGEVHAVAAPRITQARSVAGRIALTVRLLKGWHLLRSKPLARLACSRQRFESYAKRTRWDSEMPIVRRIVLSYKLI